MPKLIQQVMSGIALAIALTWIPQLQAQQPDRTDPAPVPTQIFTAKKVFISNATGESVMLKGAANPYDDFYAALKI
jgi:hypothetical protein